jgi:hypothetical protein
MQFVEINPYQALELPGDVQSVIQHNMYSEPDCGVTIASNKAMPNLRWNNSVLEVTYTKYSSTLKKYYKCKYLEMYNPDYALKDLDASSNLYSEYVHQGILRSKDIEIIWGKLPPNLTSLRQAIFDYVVNKHDGLAYSKEYHWPRAFLYCLQLLEAYGAISYYRFMQPLHCKNYDLVSACEIPNTLPTNLIAKQAQVLITVVGKAKKEIEDMKSSLTTLSSLRDCLDSNQDIAPLLEGICLLILAALAKPERYRTWIHL